MLIALVLRCRSERKYSLNLSKIISWQKVIKLARELITLTMLLDCPFSLGINKIRVDSPSYRYGSRANFSCPENSKLFDKNGVYIYNLSTTCNEDAKWENSEDLQCWKGIDA